MKGLNRLLFSGHLEEGEHVVRLVHKHWLTAAKELWKPTIFLIMIAALTVILRSRPYVPTAGEILAVIGVVWWVRNFFDFFLDTWIITDQGIIDIQWHGLFHRESTRVLYSDIQGVSYEIKGIVQTLLKMGTISVEKVSTGSAIAMETICNPRSIEVTILKSMESYLHAKNLKNAHHVHELLAELVAEHAQLRDLPPH